MSSLSVTKLLLEQTKRYFCVLAMCFALLPMAEGKPVSKTSVPKSLHGLSILFPTMKKSAKESKDTKEEKVGKKDEKGDAAKKAQARLLKGLRSVTSASKVNNRDEQGQTPLMHAAALNARLAVCWLVAKGADVTVKDGNGKTAYDYANSVSIRELLRICADEKKAPEEWETDLLKNNSSEKLLEWLYGFAPCLSKVEEYVKSGLDFKQKTPTPPGGSPRAGKLILSAAGIQPECVAYLVRRGCDINARNEDGTPILGMQTPADSMRLMFALGLKLDPSQEEDKKAIFTALVALDDVKGVKKMLKEDAELAKLTHSERMGYTQEVCKVLKDYFAASLTPENLPELAKSEQMVKELIAAGADPKTREDTFTLASPLVYAVWSHRPAAVVKALLEAGSEVDQREGSVPILDFVQDAATAELLIQQAGQDPNAKDRYGDTPLDRAVREYRPGVVQTLLKNGAKPDEGKIPTVQQAFYNDMDRVDGYNMTFPERTLSPTYRDQLTRYRFLPDIIKSLSNAGAKIDEQTWRTAAAHPLPPCPTDLPVATLGTICVKALDALLSSGVKAPADVLSGIDKYVVEKIDGEVLISIIEKFHEAGADLTAMNKQGQTLLMTLGCFSQKVAQWLIDKGIDVKIKDKAGETALFSAKTPEVMDVLIKAGLDINEKNSSGETPLMDYVKYGSDRFKMLKAAIAAGADLKATDNSGNSILHAAVSANYTQEVVQTLLAAGCDPKAKNKSGRSPLFYAVSTLFLPVDAAKLLIKVGADPCETDKDGITPLHLALSSDPVPEKVRLLIKAGADVNARDERLAYQDTPLSAFGKSLKGYSRVPAAAVEELLKAGAKLDPSHPSDAKAIEAFKKHPEYVKLFEKYKQPLP